MANMKIFGQPVRMARNYIVPAAVVITNSLATTAALDLRRFAGGSIWIPANGPTSLTVYGRMLDTGDFQAYHDEDNIAVVMTATAERVRQLPASVFGLPWAKFVGNVATSTCYLYLIG